MWREMTAIVVLALMSGSLTAEREEFLRLEVHYALAQVRMERAACALDRATCTAERMARSVGLEVAP